MRIGCTIFTHIQHSLGDICVTSKYSQAVEGKKKPTGGHDFKLLIKHLSVKIFWPDKNLNALIYSQILSNVKIFLIGCFITVHILLWKYPICPPVEGKFFGCRTTRDAEWGPGPDSPLGRGLVDSPRFLKVQWGVKYECVFVPIKVSNKVWVFKRP